MKIDVKVPAVGESITEATIAEWQKKDGQSVKRDDVLLLLETDKASVEVVAESAGVLKISKQAGEVVAVGSVIGEIDSAGAAKAESAPAKSESPKPQTPPPLSASSKNGGGSAGVETHQNLSPAVRRIVAEEGLDPASISGSGKGGRLTKADVMNVGTGATASPKPAPQAKSELPPLPQAQRIAEEEVRREPMSTIRKRIAQRLVEAQQTAAILTTFNEADMSAINEVRARYKDRFKEKYGVGLGFMGFFVKAVVEALKAYPKVNAFIEESDLLFHNYYNIGIAVGTEKGLFVPVIRHAEHLSLAEIELSIRHYAQKAREGKISVDDLSGGTFTISNGGVYGSLMSTPILNAPQSGILGMHKIEDRPVVVNGKIEIRPMMYLALSYDHRVIDGAESVSFLVRIKECLEDPNRILLEI